MVYLKELILQVSLKLERSMMEMEDKIMYACNEIGNLATKPCKDLTQMVSP